MICCKLSSLAIIFHIVILGILGLSLFFNCILRFLFSSLLFSFHLFDPVLVTNFHAHNFAKSFSDFLMDLLFNLTDFKFHFFITKISHSFFNYSILTTADYSDDQNYDNRATHNNYWLKLPICAVLLVNGELDIVVFRHHPKCIAWVALCGL